MLSEAQFFNGNRNISLRPNLPVLILACLCLSGSAAVAKAQTAAAPPLSGPAARRIQQPVSRRTSEKNEPSAGHTFLRLTAIVLGVSSPDNVYNIYSRITKILGVDHFAFDMNTGRLVIDFKPGYVPLATVTEDFLDSELEKSGFRVEEATLKELPYTRVEAAHGRKLRQSLPHDETTAIR